MASSIVLTAVYVCLSVTRGIILKEISRDIFYRAPVFRDETGWGLITIILLIVQLAIAAYFLWHSWQWFVFVFVLNFALNLSRQVEYVCCLLLTGVLMVFKRV